MSRPSDEKLAAEVCQAARTLLEGLAKLDELDPEWVAGIRKQLRGMEAQVQQQLRHYQSLKPSVARDLEVNTLTQLLHDIQAAIRGDKPSARN